MRLARIIRVPKTLKEAELEFIKQVLSMGYIIESGLESAWIDGDGPCDVLCQANIEKAL